MRKVAPWLMLWCLLVGLVHDLLPHHHHGSAGAVSAELCFTQVHGPHQANIECGDHGCHEEISGHEDRVAAQTRSRNLVVEPFTCNPVVALGIAFPSHTIREPFIDPVAQVASGEGEHRPNRGPPALVLS
ncbi:MAG: hypothetical protein JNJ45_02270 [Chthonomonas sp.]|nr:hypothetical protein [Chthonomonas sp.]